MTERVDCPVLTCANRMPVGQIMCMPCWAKVPRTLRKSLDDISKPSSRRAELERQAIAAAQAVTS